MVSKMNDVIQKLIFPMLLAIMIQLFSLKADIGGLVAQMNKLEPMANETHSEQAKRLDIITWARNDRQHLEENNHKEH